ncbi:hypothetical protein BDZ97DRAFT_855130 [Flammula alnicola]|nr:hypothetical protein BDZ97DRAFT_855130 [Flammula alnicola]
MSAEENAKSTIDQPHIDKLPDEILGIVFLLNTAKALGVEIAPYDPHATTLSTILVCRRWHDVALSYPDIWSRIIDYERHPSSWVKELLHRSKSLPIDVGEDSVFKPVQLRNPRARAVLEHIFEESARLRTLSLQIRLAPWEFICQSFLQHPAPSIEYLNLITSCPFPDSLYPGPLFSNQAPNLRRLHLQRCLIDFSSIALSNLTELSVLDILAPGILSLRRPDHPLKVAPTVAGWLHILENLPSLKYLTLSSAITHSEDNDSIPTVHLPNLLFLTIGARFHDGVAFLHHISVPQSCGIRLRLSCNRASPGLDGVKLLSFLGNQLSHWSQDVPDRYLQAKILSGDRIHFGNSRRVGYIWDMTESAVIEEHSLTSKDPLVWLVLSFDSSEDTVNFFTQLLSLYDITYPTTTTLDLWLDEDFATSITNPTRFPSLSTLHSFTAVKTLNLLERSPLYLLPIFQHSSLANRPLLPALRSLRLTRTDFEDQQRAAYFTVIAFLLWRAEVHIPLVDLQIIESKISKETEESLARMGSVKVSLGTLRSQLLDQSSDEDN